MARVTTNEAALRRLSQEMAVAYQQRRAPFILARMRAEAPVDTGLMQASHTRDPVRRIRGGWLLRFRVTARSPEGFPYPIAVHEGRGEVRPVRAKALRWVNKQGVVVFARRSRPSRPNPWMWRTFVRIGFRNVTRNTRSASRV